MIYAREALSPSLEDEMQALTRGFYHQTSGLIPMYEFRWEMYRHIEATGTLIIATARESEGARLLGFTMYYVLEHPHHRGLLVAECDCINVAADARGLGIGGGLYEFTEPLLRQAGAQFVVNRHRLEYGKRPIFERLGFQAYETVFLKKLEKEIAA